MMSATSMEPGPPQPLPFKITGSTQLVDWKKWQRSFFYYANSINLEQSCLDVQLCIFKSLVGSDALEIYNTFSLSDITDLESIIQKFNEHFKPKVNVTLERYNFYKLNQKKGQRFDDFLSDITNQVDKCEFKSMRDEIVLYKIVGGIDNDRIRNALLADADLKFDKAVQICRASSAMNSMSGKENVCQIATVKEEEELRNIPNVSHKSLGKSFLESKAKDLETTSEIKIECYRSLVAHQQSDTEKVTAMGSAVEKFLTENVVQKPNAKKEKPAVEIFLEKNLSTKKGSKLSDSEENENRAGSQNGAGGSDGEYSTWRADEDQHDYGNIETKVEIVTMGQLSDGGDWKGYWKGDDYQDDCADLETKVEIVTMGQRLKNNTAQKNGGTGETREKAKRFPCEICGRAIASKKDLYRHRKTHVQDGNFTCHYCGARCKLKRYLVRHICRLHPGIIESREAPKTHTCEVCGYQTKNMTNMRRHKYQHTEDRPLSCELCDYKCIVPRLMKAHMAKHTGKMPLSCPFCPKGFIEPNGLKKHILTHMPPEEKAQSNKSHEATCEICGMVLCHKGALKVHMRRHTGEKPFTCDICGHRTATNGGLTTHLKVHSEEKPFVCNLCGYSCKLKTRLQAHMLRHTKEKPHACKVCDRKFSQSSHVKRHMLTHTGDKPHVCEICGHRWTTRENLKAHMKVHEKNLGDATRYTPPLKQQDKPVVIIVAADSDESGLSEYGHAAEFDESGQSEYEHSVELDEFGQSEDDLAAADAIIKWSEQISANNSIEYTWS